MKRFLFISILFSLSNILFGQARVVINNDGYLVIDNSAFVVLENANANALTTAGTGGNILSEDETDVIQWEIGTTTGTYVIPWTTNSGTKIPLTINKTTTGTGATAEFILSTWETSTDMNVPYPSAVTNLDYHVSTDGSLKVIDRFWHIDALSYAAKPDINLTIAYDDAANEMVGTNTITEANLQAQRFNTGLNHWQEYKLFGTVNTGANEVSGIAVPAADFFEDWILVDNTQPLPVKLLSFEAECRNNEVEITWTTETEINNDYFVVEKSNNAVDYYELVTVPGAGNSTVTQSYTVTDDNPYDGANYYRLKQVDYDGAVEYHEVITSNCSTGGFEVNQLTFSNNTLSFNIENSIDEHLYVYFYDARGRIISTRSIITVKGNTPIRLSNLDISKGIYMLSLVGEQNKFSTKIYKKD